MSQSPMEVVKMGMPVEPPRPEPPVHPKLVETDPKILAQNAADAWESFNKIKSLSTEIQAKLKIAETPEEIRKLRQESMFNILNLDILLKTYTDKISQDELLKLLEARSLYMSEFLNDMGMRPLKDLPIPKFEEK